MNSVEERLKTLVSYRSTGDNPMAITAVIDEVERQLTDTPLRVRRFENKGIPLLVATSQDTEAPTLWLAAHADVVDAADALFTMRAEGDILLGRGVVDDKFAIAAFIEAVQQLGEKVVEHNFGIMITGDEETGGMNGTGFLIDQKGYRGEVAFVPDSGLEWQIETQAKGALRFIVKAQGTTAHGSRPWLGENAIEKLINALEPIREALDLLPMREAKDGFVRTLNIGTIHGGDAANQVPAHAEAQLDIRYIYPYEAEEIRLLVVKAIDSLPGVSVEEIANVSPVFTDPNDPWMQKFITILESEKITPGFSRSFGGTDARYFADNGMSVIVAMPPGGNLHSDGEWIERRGLEQLVSVTKKLIQET